MSYIMPLMILLLLGYALYKRVNVYEAFTRGAQEALPLLVQVLPFMAAMMIAMNLFGLRVRSPRLSVGLSRSSASWASLRSWCRCWCCAHFPAARRLRCCRMCSLTMGWIALRASPQA